jgi:hypothetical protein
LPPLPPAPPRRAQAPLPPPPRREPEPPASLQLGKINLKTYAPDQEQVLLRLFGRALPRDRHTGQLVHLPSLPPPLEPPK